MFSIITGPEAIIELGGNIIALLLYQQYLTNSIGYIRIINPVVEVDNNNNLLKEGEERGL